MDERKMLLVGPDGEEHEVEQVEGLPDMAHKEAEIRECCGQVLEVVNAAAKASGGGDEAAVEAFRCCVLGLSAAYVWDGIIVKRLEAAKADLEKMEKDEAKRATGFMVASTVAAMLQGISDMVNMVSSERKASQKGRAN